MIRPHDSDDSATVIFTCYLPPMATMARIADAAAHNHADFQTSCDRFATETSLRRLSDDSRLILNVAPWLRAIPAPALRGVRSRSLG